RLDGRPRGARGAHGPGGRPDRAGRVGRGGTRGRRDGRGPVSRTGTTTRDRGSSRPPGRRPASVTPLRTSRHLVRRRRALLALGGVLVLVLLGWGLWSGPLLAVRTVQVDGATTLPADVVRDAAG